MRYEIESVTNAVRIFDVDNVEVIYQPTWPDGSSWSSVAEASAWADQQVLSMLDIAADLAGPSPDSPVIPRPTPIAPPAIPGTE
jgi:hypothetical protein